MKLKVLNRYIIIKECRSFKKKLFGLMFKKNFDYGIVLKKCNSIHTFFMKENIDIIMTDKNYKALYIFNNLKKNRIVLPKRKVFYTFEIPSGLNIYKINDKLKIKNN